MNLYFKLGIPLLVLSGAFLGGYKAGSLSGDAEVAELERTQALEREEAAVKLSQEVLANELLKAKIAKQTQDNLALIGQHHVPVRMQLPATLCSDYGQADAPGGGESAESRTRILSKEIERILSADRQRTAGIVTEAEVELAHCREVKVWALSYTPK